MINFKYKIDDNIKIHCQGMDLGKVVFKYSKGGNRYYLVVANLITIPTHDCNGIYGSDINTRCISWSNQIGIDLSSLQWKEFIDHIMLEINENDIFGLQEKQKFKPSGFDGWEISDEL